MGKRRNYLFRMLLWFSESNFSFFKNSPNTLGEEDNSMSNEVKKKLVKVNALEKIYKVL